MGWPLGIFGCIASKQSICHGCSLSPNHPRRSFGNNWLFNQQEEANGVWEQTALQMTFPLSPNNPQSDFFKEPNPTHRGTALASLASLDSLDSLDRRRHAGLDPGGRLGAAACGGAAEPEGGDQGTGCLQGAGGFSHMGVGQN